MERRNETYCTYRKQSGKGAKQGTLEMDANYFTTSLWKKEWDRNSGEGGKRVSDRLMAMKLEIKESILNIISAYSSQVNNSI